MFIISIEGIPEEFSSEGVRIQVTGWWFLEQKIIKVGVNGNSSHVFAVLCSVCGYRPKKTEGKADRGMGKVGEGGGGREEKKISCEYSPGTPF